MKSITLVKHKTRINTKIIFSFLISFVIFLVLIAMVAKPELYSQIALNSIIVWATILLPTIFPFMLYTKFLTGLGLVEPISKIFSPLSKKFYNTPGISSFVYLISIMSGYPVGAKLTTDLYLDGKLNRGEAQRTITYCANCGPMFLIGTIGVGFLINKYAGYIILISHFLGSILNGLIFRKYHINDKKTLTSISSVKNEQDFLSSSILNSANSMFIVGAFVVVFFVLIEFLNQIFAVNSSTIFGALFNGFFEITHGCKDIASLNISITLKTILCCFVATFGGLSTAMQSITFLKKIDLSIWFFLLLKFTHAIISAVICIILSFIFL